MFAPTGHEEPLDRTNLVDVLGEFENWLLDLVTLDGVGSGVGYAVWHRTPIDLWVQHRRLSWEWADLHPLVREYRRLVEGVHWSLVDPIPAYEALAILNLLKTLIRYRMA